jgi:hypothetical protein
MPKQLCRRQHKANQNCHRPELLSISRLNVHTIRRPFCGGTDLLDFPEVCLQYLENSKIYNLLLNQSVVSYFRYVDDILIVYNEDVSNIDILLHQFNNLTPKLKFTIEKEPDRKINFLDVTINRGIEKFTIDIHRKPTCTDIIIPEDSCQPKEHKMAAIRYFYNRMNKYQISP